MESYGFITWIILSILIASFAKKRGRRWLVWIAIACLTTPLVAVILLFIMPDLSSKSEY